MLSPDPPYRLSHMDYMHIKSWLQCSKQQFQAQPPLSPAFEYFPINYTFSFKKIQLEQYFINKHVRSINMAANNGMRIMAGIQNQGKSFIAKPFQKGGLFCHINVQQRLIEFLEEATLGFYGVEERVPGQVPAEMGKDWKLNFVIQFFMADNYGNVFHLGSVRYGLGKRIKQSVYDVEIFRNDQKEKIGFIQCSIDMPDRLGLSYFIPAYCIIDQSFQIPPCKKIELKNKALPYTLLPIYNICFQNISLRINNYDMLIKMLQKCSPYFTDFHHQNIRMQVTKINLIVGQHNGWMILTDLPGGKQKTNSPKNSPSKNLSRVFSYGNDKQRRQLRKNISMQPTQPPKTHYIFNFVKLASITGQENVPNTKSITFKIAQNRPISQVKIQSSNQFEKFSQSINLQYFQAQKSQLVGVLQFMVKYSINATIKQEKNMKFNIFWAPLTFNTAQNTSFAQISMIQHIELPGYPIQWIKINENYKQISACLTYRCINDNPQLHKSAKKQRLTSYTNITKTRLASQNSIQSQQREEKQKNLNSYYNLLLEQLENNSKQQKSQTLHKKNLLKSTQKIHTQTSFLKQQQIFTQIQKLLLRLEKTLKPRLTLSVPTLSSPSPSPSQSSLPLNLPYLLSQTVQKFSKPIQGINLVGNSYNILLRLRQFLPLTDRLEGYYLPRKMLITFYAFRNEGQAIAVIDNQSFKMGIPILLRNVKRNDFEGFFFNYHLDGITEEEAGIYQNGNHVIVTVYDLENMLFYGIGSYPTIRLFIQQNDQNQNQNTQNPIPSQSSVSSNPANKHFRIPLFTPSHSPLGFLLLSSTLTPLPATFSPTQNPPQLPLSTLLPTLTQKQRQLLRIQTFTGNPNSQSTKRSLIEKYKKSHIAQYTNRVTELEYGNDLVIEYEIGKVSYGWVTINNSDLSGNNLFTFYIDCQFVQLVIDKSVYQRVALAEAKREDRDGGKAKGRDGKWRNQLGLNYVMGKQGLSGHYQGKIMQNIQYDILIKVLNNEWSSKCPQVTMVNIQVKRNTMPYKNYKIRLNLKKPLIDELYHMDIMVNNTNSTDGLKLKIPQKIIEDNGQYINTLTVNTMYNPKEKVISLVKINQENVGEIGHTLMILIGVYFEKNCQNLKRTIFIHTQCMQGEKVKLSLGQPQQLKIPILSENITPSDRIYYFQLSNPSLSLSPPLKLYYFSQLLNSTPCLLLRSLRPMPSLSCYSPSPCNLVISVLSLQQKLIKKYLLEIQCSIPIGCHVEQVQIEGHIGQRLIFVMKNPYRIQFGFWVWSTGAIQFGEFSGKLGQQRKDKRKNEKRRENGREAERDGFKIGPMGSAKVVGETVDTLEDEEYVVLSDCLHRVVSIFLIKKRKRQQKNTKNKSKFSLNDEIKQSVQNNNEFVPSFANLSYKKQYQG